ncbi:MAG: hypothetical protein LBO82_02895, partial [Synergistaceae bacterium]|nr:hypothetical protein [Synergistaceae bacterium]
MKFGLFSWKSARKTGLLALSLLLAAAPRAWGVGFEITDASGNLIEPDAAIYSNNDGVLIISADELPSDKEVVISGDGKSIVVNGNGSDVNLTLKDLTVSADSGKAFTLNAGGSKATIKIDGPVTLNGGKNGAFGFGILALKGAFVVLDAVSKGSILTVSGGK